MAKSPDDAMATMVANLKEKTGKSLDQWVQIAKASKCGKHGEVVAFLKAKHGMGHGYANLVAHTAFQSSSVNAENPEDLVDAMFAGAKAGLKPIYLSLIVAIKGFGEDVGLSPKKTYVSLRRSKQFALIQPSTATRLDVGIQLKGTKPAGRLEASGSFNAMVSHRVRIEKASDVNSELTEWLKGAYDKA